MTDDGNNNLPFSEMDFLEALSVGPLCELLPRIVDAANKKYRSLKEGPKIQPLEKNVIFLDLRRKA